MALTSSYNVGGLALCTEISAHLCSIHAGPSQTCTYIKELVLSGRQKPQLGCTLLHLDDVASTNIVSECGMRISLPIVGASPQ